MAEPIAPKVEHTNQYHELDDKIKGVYALRGEGKEKDARGTLAAAQKYMEDNSNSMLPPERVEMRRELGRLESLFGHDCPRAVPA